MEPQGTRRVGDRQTKAPIRSTVGAPDRKLGPLTEAGRNAERFEALQGAIIRGAIAEEGARASKPGPTRTLSKSQLRLAGQLAAEGARLINEGKYAQAIERLKRAEGIDPNARGVKHDLGLALLMAHRFAEAVAVLGEASGIDPTQPSTFYNLGFALDCLGRENEAMGAYEASAKLAPDHYHTQTRLGALYQARGRISESIAAFGKAALAAPSPQLARVNEARAAYLSGDLDKADRLLRAAIAAEPALADAHAGLGQMLAQRGQSAEAAESFERAVAADPNMASGWQGVAINRKFTPDDDPLIARIRASLDRPQATPAARQAIHFALAKIYDDIGNYADAAKHAIAANDIRKSGVRFDRAEFVKLIGGLIAATPLGYLDRRPDFGSDDATPIFIVGMPRSGTTLVEQILSSHPDVAAGGELPFWMQRARTGAEIFKETADAAEARLLADDYIAVLRAISPSSQRVTDKMPFNFMMLGLIRQVLPRATIVHCRRHPIDTCLSIFNTNFESPMEFAADRGSLVFFYRQYRRLMAHWREVLPKERFVEVDYEELVGDPEPATRRLVAACGLEWNDACLASHLNTRRIETASLWQARQPIYRSSVARWKRYEPWLGELRELQADAG